MESRCPPPCRTIAGNVVTTLSVTVNFDPKHPLVITPTYASTSAVPLALDFDLAASGQVSLGTGSPVLLVRPFITAAVVPADTKLIRVRGPPYQFQRRGGYLHGLRAPVLRRGGQPGIAQPVQHAKHDIYHQRSTYVGAPGIAALSQLSAGITMTGGVYDLYAVGQ